MMRGVATLPTRYRRARMEFSYRGERFESRDHSSDWFARQKRHRAAVGLPPSYVIYYWYEGRYYEDLPDVKRAIDEKLGGTADV